MIHEITLTILLIVGSHENRGLSTGQAIQARNTAVAILEDLKDDYRQQTLKVKSAHIIKMRNPYKRILIIENTTARYVAMSNYVNRYRKGKAGFVHILDLPSVTDDGSLAHGGGFAPVCSPRKGISWSSAVRVFRGKSFLYMNGAIIAHETAHLCGATHVAFVDGRKNVMDEEMLDDGSVPQKGVVWYTGTADEINYCFRYGTTLPPA